MLLKKKKEERQLDYSSLLSQIFLHPEARCSLNGGRVNGSCLVKGKRKAEARLSQVKPIVPNGAAKPGRFRRTLDQSFACLLKCVYRGPSAQLRRTAGHRRQTLPLLSE